MAIRHSDGSRAGRETGPASGHPGGGDVPGPRHVRTGHCLPEETLEETYGGLRTFLGD
jgi:hypothetical protein